MDKSYKLKSKILTEMGYATNGYIGGLRLTDPVLSTDPDDAGKEHERYNLFAGFKVSGYAKFNTVTGKLELKGHVFDTRNPITPDASIPANELSASVKWAPKKLPISVEGKRAMEIGAVSNSKNAPKIRTTYDKLSVIIDTRGGSKKVYLVSETNLYLMEGVESLSAVGIKEKLRAGVASDKLGDFYLVFDAAAVVAQKDPFYESAPYLGFGTGWEKKLTKFLSIGALVEITSPNPPFFMFEEPGSVTPEHGKREGVQVQADGWVRASF